MTDVGSDPIRRSNFAARRYEATAHPFTTLFAEDALAHVPVGPGDSVLDVAAGTGALARAAARTGARVLATDLSPEMVARISAVGIANVRAEVMDGQALDLPDERFDAVFSVFGVIMFPDWRKGLAEMARVTRRGGYGVVATWRDEGAATFLLLTQIRARLFPAKASPAIPAAMVALSDPQSLADEMVAAGFGHPQIEFVTHDYGLDLTELDDPDAVFGMSPHWADLNLSEQEAIVAAVRRIAGVRTSLPIPSTALIAIARR